MSCRRTSDGQRCIDIWAKSREKVEDLDKIPLAPPDVLDLETC